MFFCADLHGVHSSHSLQLLRSDRKKRSVAEDNTLDNVLEVVEHLGEEEFENSGEEVVEHSGEEEDLNPSTHGPVCQSMPSLGSNLDIANPSPQH